MKTANEIAVKGRKNNNNKKPTIIIIGIYKTL